MNQKFSIIQNPEGKFIPYKISSSFANFFDPKDIFDTQEEAKEECNSRNDLTTTTSSTNDLKLQTQ